MAFETWYPIIRYGTIAATASAAIVATGARLLDQRDQNRRRSPSLLKGRVVRSVLIRYSPPRRSSRAFNVYLGAVLLGLMSLLGNLYNEGAEQRRDAEKQKQDAAAAQAAAIQAAKQMRRSDETLRQLTRLVTRFETMRVRLQLALPGSHPLLSSYVKAINEKYKSYYPEHPKLGFIRDTPKRPFPDVRTCPILQKYLSESVATLFVTTPRGQATDVGRSRCDMIVPLMVSDTSLSYWPAWDQLMIEFDCDTPYANTSHNESCVSLEDWRQAHIRLELKHGLDDAGELYKRTELSGVVLILRRHAYAIRDEFRNIQRGPVSVWEYTLPSTEADLEKLDLWRLRLLD
jgi:hypothetical protein